MSKGLRYKYLPVIYPSTPSTPSTPSLKKTSRRIPSDFGFDLQPEAEPEPEPELVIHLPSIEEIRKKYRPSALSPLRQRNS